MAGSITYIGMFLYVTDRNGHDDGDRLHVRRRIEKELFEFSGGHQYPSRYGLRGCAASDGGGGGVF